MTDALKLFFSYSHQDETLRNKLGNHLKILEYQGLISSWHDRKITAGGEWDGQIRINQDTADIILLLISADFIASRYCWDVEMTRAMELHEAGKACVIPVILRSAEWTNAPFSKLQAVPQNAQPVTSFPDQDAAFLFVTQQIRQAATELIERRRQQREQQQKEANITTYRQQVQTFASDTDISLGERFILKTLQKNLGLTDLEVQDVEQAILNPAAIQKKLESYQQFFVDAIAQHGYPFNENIRKEAILVQRHLELSDAEVAQVEGAIAAQQQEESEQINQSSIRSKRNPNRSYQELKDIAISNHVGELFNYLVEKSMLSLAWAGTNRNSVTFSAKNSRKVLFSLNPVDSSLNEGLKFQIYIERFAEILNTEVENLLAVLPNSTIAWTMDWSGTVYVGFFKTLEEATYFISKIKELQAHDPSEI